MTTEDDCDWIPTTQWPGYAVDKWCRLKNLSGGTGRQAGQVMTQTREWWNSKQKSGVWRWRFHVYFQITVGGARLKIPYYDVAIERNKLEETRRNA